MKRPLKLKTKVSRLHTELKFLRAAFGYGANNNDKDKDIYDSVARSIALVDEIFTEVKKENK